MRTMLLIVILGSATMTMLQAQNVNWKSFNGTGGNLVYADFGYDFGVTTQVGYGRMVNAIRPVLLTIDYSMPMG
ncbi:MAG: hypothetical protein KDC45_08430, partial [Bacteroidetes bacterium]|nr:hypothetical protein [Bacteroidota bacterium]